jgi:uncharacterized protein DUF4190
MSVGSGGRRYDEHRADWNGVIYVRRSPAEEWIRTTLNVSAEALGIIRLVGQPVDEGPSGENLYIDPDPRNLDVPDLRPPEVPKVNGLATTARIFSWLGLLALPIGIIGLILGYMALGQIASDDAASRSVARTAIIVGWIFTGLTVIVAVLVLSHS